MSRDRRHLLLGALLVLFALAGLASEAGLFGTGRDGLDDGSPAARESGTVGEDTPSSPSPDRGDGTNGSVDPGEPGSGAPPDDGDASTGGSGASAGSSPRPEGSDAGPAGESGAGRTLTGQVVGPDGEPLAGARVFLYPEGGRRGAGWEHRLLRTGAIPRLPYRSDIREADGPTAADGSFAVGDLEEAARWRAVIVHPDHPVRRRDLRLPAGGRLDPVRLRVEAWGGMAVHLSTREGRPLGRGEVQVEPPWGEGLSRPVGENGRVRLTDLTPGQHLVTWSEWPGETRTIDVASGEEATVQLVLPGVTVRGTVFENGRPLAGAEVDWESVGNDRPGYGGRTDGEGRYELHGVRPGPYRVTLRPEGRGPEVRFGRVVTIPDRPAVERDLRVPAGRVTVLVVGPEGRPRDASVRLERLDPGGERPPEVWRDPLLRSTGEDGRRTFRWLPPGTYRLVAHDLDHAPTAAEVRVGDGGDADVEREVRIVLERGFPLALDPVDPDGRPVEGADHAFVELVDAETGRVVFSGTEHTLLGVPPRIRRGTYDVYVRMEGWAEVRLLDRTLDGSGPIRVPLEPPGTLRVVCRGAGDEPVPDVTVRLTRPNGTDVRGYLPENEDSRGTTRTDEEGVVERPILPAGRYSVRGRTADGRTAEAEARVVAGAMETVELRLP